MIPPLLMLQTVCLTGGYRHTALMLCNTGGFIGATAI